MRRFVLQRDVDETGVSGTGVVAWGCQFPNGKVALTWATGVSSCTWFDSLEHVATIHGHGGLTQIVFADHDVTADDPELNRILDDMQGSDHRNEKAYL